MATIVLSAVGQVVGGPIGSAVGALIGSQIDQLIFKPGDREGARLKELRITTSSYGTPMGRHYGKIRVPGSIIWATDLAESSESQGGGKGQPSVTTYSYSSSFAVALSSRPIKNIGRIWADGNLLRGAAGDLKVGGELRIYLGHGDQQPDPLLASAIGPECPAYRGLAYCVFESLELADFGNRIPSLSFEVIADDGEVSLAEMIRPAGSQIEVDRPLPSLVGFSEEGGPLMSSLESIATVYPFSCDASGQTLTVKSSDTLPGNPALLPQTATDLSGDGFGPTSGKSRRRQADLREIPEGLRYYDLARDYQAGLQRADGRARPGRSRVIDFPGALDASDARGLANQAAERATWEKETILWRIAELDPAMAPGRIVVLPGKPGLWRIENWELRETGVELELQRMPHSPARIQPADPGISLRIADIQATPTELHAFELPWDGTGSGTDRQVYAAASSTTSGWAGAALYAVVDGGLEPVGTTGRRRTILGTTSTALAPGNPALLSRVESIEVELASEDFQLVGATAAGLAGGANKALLGSEIIQFAHATPLSSTRWRLSGLLRGRAGTERHATERHPSGTRFVLLDNRPMLLDPARIASATAIAATGLADITPVTAPIELAGTTLRPLSPVHGRATPATDNSLTLSWTRRSRGAWEWPDLVDAPLNEQAERYLVGLGDPQSPDLLWEVSEPALSIAPATAATLAADHAGKPIWVRQVGSFSASDPLLLHTIA
ncbi:phage tail protein [Alteraurantiacibacter aquimixticola]|uniref:Uncharacterized protein n=1 Tax=Alteraurantiacibacter aquimixticola TaxID=2489173 RepID=A0A4T3EZ06_9SPHN|nr:phage tail protein [Alteraurantiacibacter aquimixticola]TIX49374.1 hypothetical protein E5222_10980 [Alteraurantiacibacter aquimixticola]